MGFILFIVATILWIPLTVINLAVVLFRNVRSHGFLRVMDEYFRDTAISIDRFGNHNFRTTLNAVLREEEGEDFGDVDETISYVLGLNKLLGTLTATGRALCWILSRFDKNHCEKSLKQP